MKMSTTWHKIRLASLAVLMVLFAIILMRTVSDRVLDTEVRLTKHSEPSPPGRQVSDGQKSRDQLSVVNAQEFNGLSEIERVELLFGAIRKNGIWLPVTNHAERLRQNNDTKSEADAETPLYITTGTLPYGRVGKEYLVSMDAVGGQQPYRWSVESGDLPQPLRLNPATGEIAGTAEQPTSGRFRIRVTDANAQSDIAEYTLAIEPTDRLELVTDALPFAYSGESYSAILEATGGLPPYRWSLEGEFGLVGTFEIDSANGVLQGSVLEDLESSGLPLRIVVQDQQVAVEKELILPISVSSTTGENTDPASDSPTEPESETPDIESTGSAEANSEDAEETSPENPIRRQVPTGNSGLVTGNGSAEPSQETPRLTAAISLRRIGLAWVLPVEFEGAVVRLVRSEGGFAETAQSGLAIFEGNTSNAVDAGLNPGVYYYTVFVSGIAESVARIEVYLPPAADVDPFGVRVTDQNLLHPAAYQAGRLPEIVTGAPRGTGLARGSADVVSLGAATNDDGGASAPYGGNLTIELAGTGAWDGPGADFTVFENVFYVKGASGNLDPNTRFMEPAIVSVSQDGVTFRQFPFDFSPRYDAKTGELNLRHPYAYHRGFAGINPVLSNGIFPDPTDPRLSGGDSFDIGELGLDWIRFVRIQSIGDRWLVDSSGDVVPHNREAGAAMRAFNGSGFDLDAVAAIWHGRVESQ